MTYFEVSRTNINEATKVMVNTSTYEPIDGVTKMRVVMKPAVSDYTVVRNISQMLCYIDSPIRFTFLTILEQYDIMCEWLGANESKIFSINLYISCDDTLENECVFSFDNMDDFDDFIRAIRNNTAPWYINCIKIDITDGTQITLTD